MPWESKNVALHVVSHKCSYTVLRFIKDLAVHNLQTQGIIELMGLFGDLGYQVQMLLSTELKYPQQMAF